MNRYSIALMVAFANIAAWGFFCFLIRRWESSHEGFDVDVSANQMRLLLLADLLSHFWFIWIPLCFAACLAIAWLAGLIRGQR